MQVAFSQDNALTLEDRTPVTDGQLAVMLFVDYGRSYGYQSMMAQIQIDTVKAGLDRDRQIARQNESLLTTNAISAIDLEISRLKVIWGEKQLVVAEKNLIAIASQYEAMKRMAEHFAGGDVPRDALYGLFQRGWEAGCDKGPDEVAAMKAWVDYSQKSLDRTRDLHAQGVESLAAVLEKEAQLKIAESNFRNRESRLDRCREILFPSREQIEAIGR